MTTQKDIAKKLNLSISTVSRVLSHDKTLTVLPETRRQILDVAKALGYISKSAKTTKKLIGLISALDAETTEKNPLFQNVKRGIDRYGNTFGVFSATLFKTAGTYDFSAVGPMDGIIAIGRFSTNDITVFNRLNRPIVFVGSSPDVLKYDAIIVDTSRVIHQAVEWLIDKNYQPIGYIGISNPKHHLIDKKTHLIRQALLERNMLDTSHIHTLTDYDPLDLNPFNKRLARAYICETDGIALKLMRLLQENHTKIPETVAIMSLEESTASTYAYPSLTTTQIPYEAMGTEALEVLVQKMHRPNRIPVKRILPTRLIKRQST